MFVYFVWISEKTAIIKIRQDVSRRRIGAINSRYVWVAQMLGVTFVGANSWVDDRDFGRNGLHNK